MSTAAKVKAIRKLNNNSREVLELGHDGHVSTWCERLLSGCWRRKNGVVRTARTFMEEEFRQWAESRGFAALN